MFWNLGIPKDFKNFIRSRRETGFQQHRPTVAVLNQPPVLFGAIMSRIFDLSERQLNAIMAAPLRLEDYLKFSGFVDVYADAALDVLGEIDVALEYLSTDTLSDIVPSIQMIHDERVRLIRNGQLCGKYFVRVQWISSAIVRLMKACA